MATRFENRPARERILETAEQLFYQKGINNVGVDEVVARSGVAKMTLYSHFKSKDLLVAEFLRQRDRRWMEWFVSAVERGTADPRGRLLAMFDALEEWFGRPDFRGCAFINAAIELADPEHPGYRASLEHKRVLHDYIVSLARAAELADPERVARSLFLLLEGAIVVALMGGGPGAARDARRAAEDLLAAGSGR